MAEAPAPVAPAKPAAVDSSGGRWPSPALRVQRMGGAGRQVRSLLASLDAATRGGLRPGVHVLAGPPGSAKTSLAVFLAWGWTKADVGVVVLAADEQADGLLTRYGQAEGLERDDLEGEAPGARKRLAGILRARPLAVLDAGEGATIEDAVAEARRLGAMVLVVDSLQTATAAGTREAKDLRLRANAVVAALKAAAREFVVLVTCEVSRGGYRSKDRVNPMASFKESGAIEYAADLALLLEPSEDRPGCVDIAIVKNRRGDKRSFRVAMHSERATFAEVETSASSADRATTDIEAVRDALRKHPGIAGNEKLITAARMNKTRGRAAIKALGGEIENRGSERRPQLHLREAAQPAPGESGDLGEEGDQATRPPAQPAPNPPGEFPSYPPTRPTPFRGAASGASGDPIQGRDSRW